MILGNTSLTLGNVTFGLDNDRMKPKQVIEYLYYCSICLVFDSTCLILISTFRLLAKICLTRLTRDSSYLAWIQASIAFDYL